MRTGGDESGKIWDSQRHKENTKRIETHDDNTDDDDDDDDNNNNNKYTTSIKQVSITNYINRHKNYARGICTLYRLKDNLRKPP